MKLYYRPGECSLAPHIIMREAGIEAELRKVNTVTKEIEGGGDYLEINPKGYVPSIEISDGELLTEIPAILQYLGEQYPEAGLTPDDVPQARYRLQEMLVFVGSEVHKYFQPFMYPPAGEVWRSIAKERLLARLDMLNQRLEQSDYLFGSRLTVVDAYLFAVLRWSPRADIDLGQWPGLDRFFRRMFERPAVQAAMRAEGLID